MIFADLRVARRLRNEFGPRVGFHWGKREFARPFGWVRHFVPRVVKFVDLSFSHCVDDVLLKRVRLSDATHVRVLRLRATSITDDALKHLPLTTALSMLDLGETTITDVGVRHLAGVRGISELFLDDTAVTDLGLRTLAGNLHLRYLALSGTAVTIEGLRSLFEIASLQGLYLARTRVTSDSFSELRQRWPGIIIHDKDDRG